MSLNHVVLLRFTEGTDAATVEAIAEALRGLPDLIPELGEYRLGADLGLADGTWDFGIVARFASTADWQTYRDHPAHQKVIHDLIAPRVAERSSVQYAV